MHPIILGFAREKMGEIPVVWMNKEKKYISDHSNGSSKHVQTNNEPNYLFERKHNQLYELCSSIQNKFGPGKRRREKRTNYLHRYGVQCA